MESLNIHVDNALEHIYHAGRTCSDCEEDLMLAEDVVLVQIVLPQIEGNQVVLPAYENPDGSYAYEPYIFHDHCWGENMDRLHIQMEDWRCIPKPDQYSFTRCSCCDSGIRVGEPMCLVEFGHLVTSKRVPNGEPSVIFEQRSGNALHLCLFCIRTMNDEVIEMWEAISYCGECIDCTYDRNWRDGTICNHEQEED